MADFCAGFGRQEITPRVGGRLVGYGNRAHGSDGMHDRLMARAMVLEANEQRAAVCSVEMCYIAEPRIEAIRAAVARRAQVPAEAVFVCTTHTHSGPHDADADNWERPLAELVADAAEQATKRLQSSRIGAAYGVLYGHSINRRWLHYPVDPAIGVIRVDDAMGRPLGLFTNFACHAVVLGYDNYLISGDWPGHACRLIEAELGGDAVCLFSQGGCGDINPITDGVRARMTSGHPVRAIGEVSTYYGAPDDPTAWNIGDRGGGTFAESEALGAAFCDEVLRVTRGIRTVDAVQSIWAEHVMVDAALAPEDTRAPVPKTMLSVEQPQRREGQPVPLEVMALGLDGPGIILVGEPGEIFTETAVAFKRDLHLIGYTSPLVVSYANGWQTYLPPASAFPDGGYEVNWARFMGFSPQFQARVWAALQPIATRHAP